MAAVVLQPAFEHHARMQVHSFKGDHELLVDRLIAASQRKEVSFDTLQERPLVPFFDSSEASAASFQSLQSNGRRSPPSKPMPVPASLKRHAHERSSGHLASSPPKKENEVVQGKHQRRASKAAAQPTPASSGASHQSSKGGAGSDAEMTSAPPQRKPRGAAKVVAAASASTASPQPGHGKKHQREGAAKAPAATPGGQRQSPPRKRPEPGMDMRSLAASLAAAGTMLRTPGGSRAASKAGVAPHAAKFAGPAFTNSPTPDCLPIPTSSLLLQEAADSLRSRLTL